MGGRALGRGRWKRARLTMGETGAAVEEEGKEDGGREAEEG